MPGSRERTFLGELKKSSESYAFWHHKIPDSILSDRGRFTPVKRFDLYLATPGVVIAAEVKSANTRHAFTDMRPSEEEWLETWARLTDFPAIVILNFRQKSPRLNRAFWIDLLHYQQQRKETLPTRKSLNLDMVVSGWREIPRKKRYGETVWDVSRILKFYTSDLQEE
jgi:hypothetical protein